MFYFFLHGLLNAIFIPAAVYALWTQNKRFSFYGTPLSFARKTHTRSQFVLFFVIGTLLEALFLFELFYTFPVLRSTTLMICTAIGLIASICIGITTNVKVRTLHQLSAQLFTATMIAWSLIFHTLIYSVSPIHSILGFVLSFLAITGIPYFYFYKKSVGWTELFFITIIVIWNILFASLFLIKSIV
jgi:hypothetical protein